MSTIQGRRYTLIPLIACLIACSAAAADPPGLAANPPVNDDGSITTPAFDLPFSSFGSKEAAESFVKRLRSPMPIVPDLGKMREITNERLKPQLALAKSLYPYTSSKAMIGSVPIETFVPAAGVAPENKDRVLIELHGGGFVAGGGGPGGAIESIPIMGVGRIKVVAVDYRLGPENRFPAAGEDVAAVYRELLKTHKPENIGIFGCSAGGMLAGQSIVISA